MSRIVVVGSSNTDMVVRVPSLPRPGETVLGGSFYTAHGGKGANQAVAAARAGGDVALVAAVGDDAFGAEALRAFAEEGIDASGVLRLPGESSGVALICVDERGENSIAVASGANGRLDPASLREREGVLAGCGAVLLQLEIPLDTVREAARMAADRDIPVILNPAPAQPLPDDLLARVAVLTPNQTEVERLTGIACADRTLLDEAASCLLRRGCGAVVVTLGSGGAYLAAGEARVEVPGWSVPVEDTTGAGDVFNGALAVGLAEGGSLEDAVRFANAAAALSVTRRGAQPSAPRRSEIQTLLGGSRG